MPVCSTGISQPKAGLPSDIVSTSSQISALINDSLLAWLSNWASTLGTVSTHVATLCATDPPAMPTFNAFELAALVSLNDFDAFLSAQRKLRDVVDIYLWYQLCECASVATPAPPAGPTEPTGGPVLNPPIVGTPFPVGLPCGTAVLEAAVGDNYCIPALGSATPLNGITSIDLNVIQNGPNLTSGTQVVFIRWANSAGGFVAGGRSATWSSTGITMAGTAAIPATAVAYYFCTQSFSAPVGTGTITVTATMRCGGGTGTNGPVPEPCQTSPATQLILEQILQLVTLIQRQGVPFAYIPGNVHSGLTGTGVVSVSRILGLLASTTVPNSTSLIVGTPDVRIQIGRLNLATADGYEDRVDLVVAAQVIIPPAAALFTSVGYSLEPGVTLTLTELVREP